MKKTIILLIFFMLISVIPITTNSEEYENEYGKICVYPTISTNIVRQVQFWNYTWYYPDNFGTVAFAFDDPLTYGAVYHWDGDQYNEVEHTITEYNGKTFYIFDHVPLLQDTLVEGYWEYDIKANTSGKWDMYIKLESDTWQYAFNNDRIIHLDPFWNSSWSHFVNVDVDNAQVELDGSRYELIVAIPPSIGNKCDNMNSIRFVDHDNTTVYEGYDIINSWVEDAYNYVSVAIPSFSDTFHM